jgi:glutamine synthetase
VTETIHRLKSANDQLGRERHAAEETKGGPNEVAVAFRDRVVPVMNAVREHADLLETLVDDALWPLPKYREILFLH